MTAWSKLPPRQTGLVLFTGARRIKHALYEHYDLELMEAIEDYGTLVVVQMGRYKRFPLDAFEGQWKPIDIGALAQ